MNNSIEIFINIDNENLRDIIVAELADLNFSGFEEDGPALKAYVQEDEFNETVLNEILTQYGLTYSKSIIKSRNWNDLWEKNFSPVNVEGFCLIRAHFHPASETKHEIIITPKMSFGTGHHATTYLMVQQMQYIDFNGKRVADFGTGTGVLAILAEKLGSSHVKAIDNDDWSIENASENITRNNCCKINLVKKSHFEEMENDIILANINKNVILENMDGLIFGLKKGGYLLLSGLLKDDEIEVLEAATSRKLNAINTVEKDNWISVFFQLA